MPLSRYLVWKIVEGLFREKTILPSSPPLHLVPGSAPPPVRHRTPPPPLALAATCSEHRHRPQPPASLAVAAGCYTRRLLRATSRPAAHGEDGRWQPRLATATDAEGQRGPLSLPRRPGGYARGGVATGLASEVGQRRGPPPDGEGLCRLPQRAGGCAQRGVAMGLASEDREDKAKGNTGNEWEVEYIISGIQTPRIISKQNPDSYII
ncbi:hypothetical protein BS78_10G186400 [Paspalum vaginatum]|nr:hypothetical protein BS78_10G186400 [Paspalum vaginatum]